MATQYTSILKLALPVQGELSGTWGDVVNDNITSMVEEAIAGRAVINTWTANSHTLTTADGTTSESRAAILTLTDTGTALTGAGTVICPAASKIYIVENGTGQTITVKTSAGTGVAVPNTKNMVVFCDGTNVEEGITNINSLTLNGDGATVSSIKDEDNMASDSATALATQQSIKAYVDSQVATADTLSEVLANGNTTGGTDIAVGTGDDITFADSSKAIFGAGSDLQIYHDGSNSYIQEAGSGNLYIQGSNAIRLRSSASLENMLEALENGAVTLYHNNSAKLATTSTGIDVTGVITTDGMTTSADINFGDNDKAVFGAGSDLQIYHNANNSFIQDAGTGSLYIDGSASVNIRETSTNAPMAVFTGSGSADLYHNGIKKLATTSTGIDVTGTVTADVTRTSGANTNAFVLSDNVTGVQTSGFGTRIIGQSNSGAAISAIGFEADGGTNNDTAISFYTQPGAGSLKRRMKLGLGGDISFYEDTGTTAKLFWDSSAESLGIGTSSPSGPLDVVSSSGAVGQYIRGRSSDNIGSLYFTSNASASTEYGYVQGRSTDLRIQGFNNGLILQPSSGNVGIGTSSPVTLKSSTTLQVSGNAKLGDDNGRGLLSLGDIGSTGANVGIWRGAAGAYAGTGNYLNLGGYDGITFTTGAAEIASQTERMRIGSTGIIYVNGDGTGGRISGDGSGALVLQDGNGRQSFKILSPVSGSAQAMTLDASGNLLVGKSVSSFNTAGIEARAGGTLWATADGTNAASFNRKTSDGDIALFSKDGTTVGSIGAYSSNLLIGTGDTNLRFFDSSKIILPRTGTNGASNGVIDLGDSGNRFKDLYLSGATYCPDYRSEGVLFLTYDADDSLQIRRDNGAEAARFDSSGNLLVGTTSESTWETAKGFRARNSGSTTITRDGNPPLYVNRLNSDGTLLQFQKGTAVVGSIQTNSGRLDIQGNANTVRVQSGTSLMQVTNGTQISFETAGAERMRIDSSGNVGIGSTSPTTRFFVSEANPGDNTTAARITGSTSYVANGNWEGPLQLDWTQSSNDGYIRMLNIDLTDAGTNNESNYGVYVDGEDQNYFSGNVGIGTSSPAYKAQISDSGNTVLSVTSGDSSSASLYLGDSVATRGRLTYDNSNDSLAVYTDNNERMRIDSSGRALVNLSGPVASSSAKLQVSATATTAALFNRTNDGDQITFHVNGGSSVGSIGAYSSRLFIGSGDTGIFFDPTTDDAVKPWNTSTNAGRDAAIDLGDSGTRFKDLYLSGGVYFGTGLAANKLDDYEEGTWDPEFGGEGSNPTVVYNTQKGSYTKVGRLVTVSGQIITVSRSGGSGNLTINNLPFTVQSGEAPFSGVIGFNFNWVSGEQPNGAVANQGTTKLFLYKNTSINSHNEVDDILASGNSYLYFNLTYFTA